MKFREHETTSGKIVLAGKSAENNEDLIKQAVKGEYILHTEKPGSPFVNINKADKKVSKKDIYEAGVFCARYSQDWRDNKQDVAVHVFKRSDVEKKKGMKLGTFGVKKFDKIVIKKKDIKNFERELKIKEKEDETY